MNEGGVLKLNRSMKVKSFTKGLELFQLIAGVAEAEGIYLLANKFVNMHMPSIETHGKHILCCEVTN